MSDVIRVIMFGKKRVGKKRRRTVEISRFYLSPPIKAERPIFEARVARELVLNALGSLGYDYEDRDSYAVIKWENPDEAFRRLVVFAGVRQFLDEVRGAELLDLLREMPEPELLFWFSRFMTAFDRGGYWDVHRTAKSFRILYRL